jgi:hypothetical protein
MEMALNYADSEISQIFDEKKKYDQDENYFSWLHRVP